MKSLRAAASLLAALTAGLLLSSCAQFQSAPAESLNGQFRSPDGRQPAAHVNARIWGCYLFGVLPLASGDPQGGGPCFFKDTATVANATKLLSAKAKELGGSELMDLNSNVEATGAASLGLLWYKEAQVSGTALK